MRRTAIASLLCVAAGSSAADPAPRASEPASRPWAVAIDGGVELAPLAGEDTYGRIDVAIEWRWRDRWIAGGALGLAVDPSPAAGLSASTIRTYLVELAAALHASRRFDVVLGWRAGRAGIDLGFTYVHATDLEPVAQAVIPLGDRLELRVEPLAIDFYRTTIWQTTFGVRAGLAWRH